MPYGWHDGGWGVLWMIASWALIVAIVVWIARSFDRGSSTTSERASEPHDATSILEERFARGEISEQEFLERRRVLQTR